MIINKYKKELVSPKIKVTGIHNTTPKKVNLRLLLFVISRNYTVAGL
jgi:hypothetical protein